LMQPDGLHRVCRHRFSLFPTDGLGLCVAVLRIYVAVLRLSKEGICEPTPGRTTTTYSPSHASSSPSRAPTHHYATSPAEPTSASPRCTVTSRRERRCSTPCSAQASTSWRDRQPSSKRRAHPRTLSFPGYATASRSHVSTGASQS